MESVPECFGEFRALYGSKATADDCGGVSGSSSSTAPGRPLPSPAASSGIPLLVDELAATYMSEPPILATDVGEVADSTHRR